MPRGENPTSVMLMSRVVKFDKRQLHALKNMLKAVGSRDGKPMNIAMEDFVEAIDSVGIAATPDKLILEKVYTLMDRTGLNNADFREVLSAASAFILGDKVAKIAFACEMYDIFEYGKLTTDEVTAVLSSMNTLTRAFGDVSLEDKEIKRLVTNVLAKVGRTESHPELGRRQIMYYRETTAVLASHPHLAPWLPKPID